MKTPTLVPPTLVLWISLAAAAAVLPSSSPSSLPSSFSLHSQAQPTQISATSASMSVETRSAKDAASTTSARDQVDRVQRSATPISATAATMRVAALESSNNHSPSTAAAAASHTSASEKDDDDATSSPSPSSSPPAVFNSPHIGLQPIIIQTSATSATRTQDAGATDLPFQRTRSEAPGDATHSSGSKPYTEKAHVSASTETPTSHANSGAEENAADEPDPPEDSTGPAARNIIVGVFGFLTVAAVTCCFKDKLDAAYRRIRARRSRSGDVHSVHPWVPIEEVPEKTPVMTSPGVDNRSDWRRSYQSAYSSQPASPMPPGHRDYGPYLRNFFPLVQVC
ncbi:hypothetical protein EXIGLDRAFT_728220 [Exidia glandulosa HHB12029]|uniref:Mid2 domain-containing protein n=1 Tax=Exidia glandulosa HHB12029 TaxID=1314781 RepID=A0A165D0L5_EXIGL|nr:hypothetical protein EXIGLDRAFT_728220 [Exidia glandulosa HHB12029]